MVQRLFSGRGSILSTIKASCINRYLAYPLNYINIRMASSSSGMDLTEFSKVLSKASNIDGLHWKAGSRDIVELHGSLWKTRCCRCNDVEENYENPICPALDGKGAPNSDARDAQISVSELPHCKKCNALLRPHVVWFGECLDHAVLDKAENALINCDLFLVVGTSAVVQPAAGFAPIVQGGGGIVAEFNLEGTPISRVCRFKFHGSSAETLPQALGIPSEDLLST